MPVFRINILFASGRRKNGHHLVEGIDLDTYYLDLYESAQKEMGPIVKFDVVQISEHTREAKFM